MNVIFMSLGTFYNLNDSSVHLDILKRFAEEHEVWLVCKNEDKPTAISNELGIHVLRVHTGELKKVSLIKKGINTIKVETQFKNAIKKHLLDVKFDLVLYTTPPITFANAVKYLKIRDNATTYLMLKDIFPQNAVDIGIMSTKGIRGLLYRYFRKKEKDLYKWSDYIGCMSQANCDYIIKQNPEINSTHVEICPNTTYIHDMSCIGNERSKIRAKYDIPLEKKVFVYGGNLGKPQDIPYIIKCMDACKDIENVFFLIVGAGTEFKLLKSYVDSSVQKNLKLMERLPKSDYDKMIGACDVGMIFLDHRFTIPNYPSRLLSYMQAKIPVLACTDPNTDLGTIIVNEGFGWWCESNNVQSFCKLVQTIEKSDCRSAGLRGFEFLRKEYDVSKQYEIIMKHFIEQ